MVPRKIQDIPDFNGEPEDWQLFLPLIQNKLHHMDTITEKKGFKNV